MTTNQRIRWTRFACIGLIVLSQATPVLAQTELKKIMQEKYDFRTVSCFTCHAKRQEVPADQQEAYKETPKKFFNEFGSTFKEPLKDKKLTQRIDEAKELKDDEEKYEAKMAEIEKDFLKALEAVEKVKDSSGVSYGELLKEAKLEGVKPNN